MLKPILIGSLVCADAGNGAAARPVASSTAPKARATPRRETGSIMLFLQKAGFLLITLFSAPGRSGHGPDATVSGTGCPGLAPVKRERGNVPCFARPMVNGSGQGPPC